MSYDVDVHALADRLDAVEFAAYTTQANVNAAIEGLNEGLNEVRAFKADKAEVYTTYDYVKRDELDALLYSFGVSMANLFKQHFEDGNVDISDEEFWSVISGVTT